MAHTQVSKTDAVGIETEPSPLHKFSTAGIDVFQASDLDRREVHLLTAEFD